MRERIGRPPINHDPNPEFERMAQALRADGLTNRDVAKALGITFNRVHRFYNYPRGLTIKTRTAAIKAQELRKKNLLLKDIADVMHLSIGSVHKLTKTHVNY
jgi:predicted transcriptional regulator